MVSHSSATAATVGSKQPLRLLLSWHRFFAHAKAMLSAFSTQAPSDPSSSGAAPYSRHARGMPSGEQRASGPRAGAMRCGRATSRRLRGGLQRAQRDGGRSPGRSHDRCASRHAPWHKCCKGGKPQSAAYRRHSGRLLITPGSCRDVIILDSIVLRRKSCAARCKAPPCAAQTHARIHIAFASRTMSLTGCICHLVLMRSLGPKAQPRPSAAVASCAGAVGACLAACKAAESDAELVVTALRALAAALQSDEARDEFREAAGMACVKQLATRHAGEVPVSHVNSLPECGLAVSLRHVLKRPRH